jgi:hypothetical protein
MDLEGEASFLSGPKEDAADPLNGNVKQWRHAPVQESSEQAPPTCGQLK